MGDWNPWRALRARPHIELVWAAMAPGARGGWIPIAGRAVIVLDAGLGRVDRRAVLTHELVHDERGIAYTSATPPPLVAKEERAVELETARRLVPPDELARFASRRAEVEPVTVADIATEFDVPADVAARAIDVLRHDRHRQP